MSGDRLKEVDSEKEKSRDPSLLPGAGAIGADLDRLRANAHELLGLPSPARRSLFGGASLGPPTPVTHSTPQLPPQEASRSGLSTDG